MTNPHESGDPMAEMTVQLRSIADTEAAIGWAGGHTIVVDRPDGKAGGRGLGFNGGQLLAMAIGGCMCNDLHYVAHEAGVRLRKVEVEVTVAFEGDPLLATPCSPPPARHWGLHDRGGRSGRRCGRRVGDHRKGEGDLDGQQLGSAGAAGRGQNETVRSAS